MRETFIRSFSATHILSSMKYFYSQIKNCIFVSFPLYPTRVSRVFFIFLTYIRVLFMLTERRFCLWIWGKEFSRCEWFFSFFFFQFLWIFCNLQWSTSFSVSYYILCLASETFLSPEHRLGEIKWPSIKDITFIPQDIKADEIVKAGL